MNREEALERLHEAMMNPNSDVRSLHCWKLLHEISHDRLLKDVHTLWFFKELLALEYARGFFAAATNAATNDADNTLELEEFDPESECFPTRC